MEPHAVAIVAAATGLVSVVVAWRLGLLPAQQLLVDTLKSQVATLRAENAELRAEVERLERRNQALEERVQQLEEVVLKGVIAKVVVAPV